MSECSQQAKKEYKIKYDWVGKVIHWNCEEIKIRLY